ncbi:SpoIIE family protein phosphatase [Chitinilyticum piscinae]|uniref:SpoIIE family protein phosphatase n=1 Tax=Chitinilyticum piscinae TaxID=2866724 RepID=A0A8J7FKU4_9NEIS|nr:SpoIIE family protein phosphatase [Chitinilyticum piscinae]MBE9607996.1 SpoIIE family protein phosphatase [Chitinilyticum piscinae]
MRLAIHSLKARIFLALAAILGLVACVVMAHSLLAVRESAIVAEQRSVQNVLRMAELAIRSEYHTLLAGKVALVQERKARFREFDRVILQTLAHYQNLATQGQLSEQEARTQALAWLQKIRPVGGEYLLVFDRDGVALVYPEPALLGTQLSGYTDFKGRSVVAAAWDEADRYGETVLIYDWKAVGSNRLVQRYGHFLPFRPWNWMVASVGRVDEVQGEADARLAQFRTELARSLGQVEVSGNGAVVIFDGQGQWVVPPAAANDDIDPRAKTALRAAAGNRDAVHFQGRDGRVMQGWATYVRALDWYVAVAAPEAALTAPARNLVTRQALVFAGGLLLGLLLAWAVASGIARPLVRLGQYAKGLAGADFSAAPVQSMPADLADGRQDEIGALARSFASMETALYRNVRSLVEITGERERIEGELGVARDIQLGLLPKMFPAFPERPEIDLHATLVSAREIGGDLYDFFLTGDTLNFTIGDVAGKGVPAALFMAITKTLMKAAGESCTTPGAAVCQVNDHLARDNPNLMFVTAFNGVLDLHTGELQFANAGHNPPLILRADGRCEILRNISGPALGAFEDMEYASFTEYLQPGDWLLLYTDGVTEAMDAAGQLYGETRLAQLMAACDTRGNAEQRVNTLMADLATHVGAADQSDDITVLAIRYLGAATHTDKEET